ncbi:MAG: serine/threonine-protein kinase [Anaerolineaceae bacterium]|nr:serine/threonine-protein kinase [Anaerolineaceae bacterium]
MITSWIGQTLKNRYRIEELLGQGGMSAVYKANDPNLRRVVAVKLIHPHLSGDPSFISRFEEEAAIVAQLRHENIVQVFDFDQDEQTYYMVLEYLVGETLAERLRRLNSQNRRMDLTEALKYIIQMCDALQYAHGRGLIHRDVKPANIMLDIYGRAILMDFGVARMVGGQMHTATGAVVGTAKYMSPEQIRGDNIDTRIDLYSLGVTMFETISGRPPFEADTAMTLMMMQLNDPVPDIRGIQPDVPEDVVRVIERAMEKDRSLRYQSAGDMSTDLRSIYTRLTGEKSQHAESKGIKESSAQVETVLPYKTEVVTPRLPAESKPADTQAAVQPQGHNAITQINPEVTRVENKSVKAPSPSLRSGRRYLFFGGGLLLVLGLIALALLKLPGVIASGMVHSSPTPTALRSEVALVTTSTPTQVIAVVAPAVLPTALPVFTPTATIPTNGVYIRINNIQIENGRYVVNYQTFNYQEQLSGTHEHFFFNTVPPDQAGEPGKGPWMLFAGPNPFRGLMVANRPSGATQLCALVANPDHTVQPNTGNCINLPN